MGHLRPLVPRPIQGPAATQKSEKVKLVDDSSVAVNINLKQCLVPDRKRKSQTTKGVVSSYQIGLILPSVAESDPKINQSRCNFSLLSVDMLEGRF